MVQLVSDRFHETIRLPHSVLAQGLLYHKGELIAEVPIVSGSITDDADALQRRRTSLVLAGTDDVLNLLPDTHPGNGGLWPLGNEIQVMAGIDYEDGTDELVSMGWFRVSKPKLFDAGSELQVSLSGFDLGKTISRARFVDPYRIKAGTRYVVAIRDLLISRMPTLNEDDFVFDDVPNYTTPELVFTQDDDPWEQAVKMASSVGCELFWNGDRKIRLGVEPDPLTMPSEFDYVEGEDATFVSISRELDEEETYNGVIVSGESSSNKRPVRGEAWDTNPNSPTYFDPARPDESEYGPSPYFITSSYVTTTAQAQAAAQANLLRVAGVVELMEIEAWSHYAHESNDIAKVQRERIGVNDNFVLNTLNIGIGDTAGMSIATRKRRTL